MKQPPLSKAVVVSAGSRRLYRTENGHTVSYPLADEVDIFIADKRRLVAVTPGIREWTFGTNGHSAIR